MKESTASAPTTSRKDHRPVYEDFVAGWEQIAVVGLGYVGLPLAVAFAKCFRVTGFDINTHRVSELRAGVDRTREVDGVQLEAVKPPTAGKSGPGLEFTDEAAALARCRFIVVTVPTPIDAYKRPDLTPLIGSSTTIGRHLAPGTTVVYESTVYPGCTEDDCVPIIEREGGLVRGKDFFVGYSPERINPGDKDRTVDKIRKVVAGDNSFTAELLQQIYGAVITAGVFVAASIKTAEAAKVIENTQRDLNIALMNELAVIFDRMGLRTLDVLEAAGTKWNFLPFRPGLVGGHCIGVDPYYLTFKAESLGYHPEVILAGRRINDGMGKFVAEKTVKRLIQSDRPVKGAKVLILGWTFKEDVPDIRNTRVIDIYKELRAYGVDVACFDPVADAVEVRHEYGIDLLAEPAADYDAVILAVKHRVLLERYPLEELRKLNPACPPVVVDVKGFLTAAEIGMLDWQL